MKTNIFSFNRLGLMFQRYFTERLHTELMYWSIMVIVFMFIRNVPPVMFALIAIAGVFYAARFFREIHSSSNGVAYFMIPATQFEKLTIGIIMTSFYYFAMMIIAYIIGNLLGTCLNNLLANIDFIFFNFFHHSQLQWKLFDNIDFVDKADTLKSINYSVLYFLIFLLGQSLYLLGSIYFKSIHFLKTYFSTQIIGLLLLILYIIELRLIFGNLSNLADVNVSGSDTTALYAIQIILPLLTLFFWIVSYFRLTEKQI